MIGMHRARMFTVMREPTAPATYLGLSTALLALLGGCAASTGSSGGESEGSVAIPQVTALSTYEASIGTLVEVYGTDFPHPRDGRTMLVFEGNFDAADGSTEPVDLEFETTRLDNGTLRWDSFGPYRVPFGTTGDQIGTFHGQMRARMVSQDGEVVGESEPVDISFQVRPSLLVHEFQPVTATCAGPVKRALGGAAYRIRVEDGALQPRRA